MQNHPRLFPTPRNAYDQGFTILELLLVMAIVALLATLALYGMTKQRQQANNLGFADQLAQDIQYGRSYALSNGGTVAITFTSPVAYTVISTIGSNTKTLTSASNPNIALSGFVNGDYLLCNSRGSCPAYSSSGASKSLPTITLTYDTKNVYVDLTVLGLTRVRS